MTSRENIPNIVQQGGTWGPILCSNSIDTLGKKCRYRNENFYLYKGVVKILPLAIVDDLNRIAKCGRVDRGEMVLLGYFCLFRRN